MFFRGVTVVCGERFVLIDAAAQRRGAERQLCLGIADLVAVIRVQEPQDAKRVGRLVLSEQALFCVGERRQGLPVVLRTVGVGLALVEHQAEGAYLHRACFQRSACITERKGRDPKIVRVCKHGVAPTQQTPANWVNVGVAQDIAGGVHLRQPDVAAEDRSQQVGQRVDGEFFAGLGDQLSAKQIVVDELVIGRHVGLADVLHTRDVEWRISELFDLHPTAQLFRQRLADEPHERPIQHPVLQGHDVQRPRPPPPLVREHDARTSSGRAASQLRTQPGLYRSRLRGECCIIPATGQQSVVWRKLEATALGRSARRKRVRSIGTLALPVKIMVQASPRATGSTNGCEGPRRRRSDAAPGPPETGRSAAGYRVTSQHSGRPSLVTQLAMSSF